MNYAPAIPPRPVFCLWSLSHSLGPSSSIKLLCTSQLPLNSLFFDPTVSVQFDSDTVQGFLCTSPSVPEGGWEKRLNEWNSTHIEDGAGVF